MGESRQHTDNASASSEEAIKAPPRFDLARTKIGPAALAPDEFDPLKHNEWENFWHQVDHHFHPVNLDHMRSFRSLLAANHPVAQDPDLRITHPDDFDPVRAAADARERKRDAKRESRRERSGAGAATSSSAAPGTGGAGAGGGSASAGGLAVGGGGAMPTAVGVVVTGGGAHDDAGGKRPAERPPIIKVKMETSIAAMRSTSSATSDMPSRLASPAAAAAPVPVDPDSAAMRATLNSFPYTQRLVAALIDENPSGTAAPTMPQNRASRPVSDLGVSTWIGGNNEADVRAYQTALEERVKIELRDVGLLDDSREDDVQVAMRLDQWKLRDQKTANRVRKDALYTKIIGKELREQAEQREEKRHEDKVEIAYLERMISKMKKNKKSRSKFQKLLQRMFGHYKDKDKVSDKTKKAAEITSNGRMITNGDEKVRTSGKKKKKSGKKSNHELPAKSLPAPGGPSRKSAA